MFDEKEATAYYVASRRGWVIGFGLLPMLCFLLYALIIIGQFFILQLNYNKWVSQKIDTYSVTVGYGYSGGILRTVRQVVEDGKVIGANSSSDVPVINELFEKARACVVAPLFCSAQYHEVYGYPTRYMENDWDLGNIIELVEFEPQ